MLQTFRRRCPKITLVYINHTGCHLQQICNHNLATFPNNRSPLSPVFPASLRVDVIFAVEKFVIRHSRRDDNGSSCQAKELVKNVRRTQTGGIVSSEKSKFQELKLIFSSIFPTFKKGTSYITGIVLFRSTKSLRVFVMMHVPCFCLCLYYCSLWFGLAAF